jgi:hypothetical protein
LHLSLFFSLFITPITYLGLSLIFLFFDQFYSFHDSLNRVFFLKDIEYGIHSGFNCVFNNLNNFDKFKKYYLQLKVIILLNGFKFLAYITPEKKENKLENNLQNDYLEILNRNRNKREVNEVKEVTDATNVTEVTEVTNVTNATNATDVTNVTNVTDVTTETNENIINND